MKSLKKNWILSTIFTKNGITYQIEEINGLHAFTDGIDHIEIINWIEEVYSIEDLNREWHKNLQKPSHRWPEVKWRIYGIWTQIWLIYLCQLGQFPGLPCSIKNSLIFLIVFIKTQSDMSDLIDSYNLRPAKVFTSIINHRTSTNLNNLKLLS